MLVRRAWGQGRTRFGSGLILMLVVVAIFGPYVAPHGSTDFVGPPFDPPNRDAWLGADIVGRDVLTRFLEGGRSILVMSFAATAIGITIGTAIGLVAAYSRSTVDDVLMRAVDVGLAFPSIVLGLVVVSAVGPKTWLVVLAVGLTTAPRVARVTRGAALEVVERDFVRAAEALGERRHRILLGEVLPNITGTVVVESSVRLTYAVSLIASLSFLGFGLEPPAADWGIMINENRQGLTIQPWAVVAPVLAIALLTVGTGLVGDGVARAAAGIGDDDR